MKLAVEHLGKGVVRFDYQFTDDRIKQLGESIFGLGLGGPKLGWIIVRLSVDSWLKCVPWIGWWIGWSQPTASVNNTGFGDFKKKLPTGMYQVIVGCGDQSDVQSFVVE